MRLLCGQIIGSLNAKVLLFYISMFNTYGINCCSSSSVSMKLNTTHGNLQLYSWIIEFLTRTGLCTGFVACSVYKYNGQTG